MSFRGDLLMLCDICKKNEATIHIKEIHDGEVHTANLCAACAAQKEKSGELGAFGFNLAEVLFSLGKSIENAQSGDGAAEISDAVPAGETVCPHCGWTLAKLRESGGRLGCPDCYRAFAPMIDDALGSIQRGTVHLGKRPRNAASGSVAALNFELEKQQRELAELIKREEYESAAVCRDRINQ